MLLGLLIVILLVAGIMYCVRSNHNAPPVAKIGGIPFGLGAAGTWKQDPLAVLKEARQRCGDVFTVNLIAVKFTFMLGWRAHQVFFKAHEDDLSFQRAVEFFASQLLGPHLYSNPEWNTLAMQSLARNFQRAERVHQYLSIVTEEATRTFKRWAAMEEFDLFPEVSKFITTVNLLCLLGEEVVQKHGEEIAGLFYHFEQAAHDPLLLLFPQLVPGKRKKVEAMRQRFKQLIGDEVRMRRAVRAKQRDTADESRVDYLDKMVGEFAKFEDWYLARHILSILFAAHTNTAATFAWALAEIARRPALQEDVHREVENVCSGSEGIRTPAMLNSLELLEAILRETTRMYALLMAYRMTPKPFEFGGYTIPAGTVVCISPYLHHHDPAVFGVDADDFRPSRFMDDDIRKKWTSDMSFVQFGYGAHRCLGERFAVTVLKTCWSLLFEQYRIVLCHPQSANDSVPPLPAPDLTKGGTPFPTQPIIVQLQKK